MTTISRSNNTRSRAGSRAALAQLLVRVAALDTKAAPDLTPDERSRTQAWFRELKDGLDAAIDEVDIALPKAKLDDKEGLIELRTDLVGRRTDVAQKESAFFSASTDILRPPGNDVIAETQRLTEALGKRIAAEKRAQATVTLLNDLARLVSKVLG